MRSASLIKLLLLLPAAAAYCQGPPPQTINPHTQIKWPANCTGAGNVYNYLNNTCLDMNAINPHSQITWPGNCTGPGNVYNYLNNTCLDMNAINPGSQLTWPANCTGANMVYVPTTNTCIGNGTANNPAGANWQLQGNLNGVFGGVSLMNCFSGNTPASCASTASSASTPLLIPNGVTGSFNQYTVQPALASCTVNSITGQLNIYATQLGNGYTSAPTVTWSNNNAIPVGSLGTIVANAPVNGQITGYSITGANSGWGTSTLGQCPVRITVAAPPVVSAPVVDVLNANNLARTYTATVRVDNFGCVHDGVTDDSQCIINALQYGRDTGYAVAFTAGANYYVSGIHGYLSGSADDGSVPIAATLAITVSGGAMTGCSVTNAGSNLSSGYYNTITNLGAGTGGTITPTLSSGSISSCTASGGSGYTSNFTAYAGPVCNGVPCAALAPEPVPQIPVNITLPSGNNTLTVYGNNATISGPWTSAYRTPSTKNDFTLASPYTICMGSTTVSTGNSGGGNNISVYDLQFSNCFIALAGGGAQQVWHNLTTWSSALTYLAANAQYNIFENLTINSGWGGVFCGQLTQTRSPITGNQTGQVQNNTTECDALLFEGNTRINLGGTNGSTAAQFNTNRQALDCWLDRNWVHYEDYGLTNTDSCYTPPAGYTTAWGTTARVTSTDLAHTCPSAGDIMWRGGAGIALVANATCRTVGGPTITGLFNVKGGFSYVAVLGPYETVTGISNMGDEGQYANAFQGNQGLYGSATYPNPYESWTNGPLGIALVTTPGLYNSMGGSTAANPVTLPPFNFVHNPTVTNNMVIGNNISQANSGINTTFGATGTALWSDRAAQVQKTGLQYQYAQGGNGVAIPTDTSMGQLCYQQDVNTAGQIGGTPCWTMQGKENQMPGTPPALQFSFGLGAYDLVLSNLYPAYVRVPYLEVANGPRLNGAVNSFTITNAGSGYKPGYVSCSITQSPVTIPGSSTPYQSDCAAWAGANGTITDIGCTKCGIGYTAAPTVFISPPTSGVQATATTTVNPIGNHKQVGHWIFATTYLAAGGTVPAYGTTTLAGVTCKDALFGSGNGLTDYARVVGWGSQTGDALIKTAYVTAANTCTIVLKNPTSAGIAYVAGSGGNAWIIELISVNQTVSGAVTSANTATNTYDGFSLQANGTNVVPNAGVVNLVPGAGTTISTSGGNVTISAGSIDFLSGLVERCMVSGAGFTCQGDNLANSTGATAAVSGAGGTWPIFLVSTSSTTTGQSSGWNSNTGSNMIPFYSSRQPSWKTTVGFSNATDFNTNSLVNVGLVGSSCTPATFTASNNPACSYATIQYSTVRGDTSWQCVTGNGSSQTVTSIGVAPTTALTTMSINMGASSVTCTVGGTSVTNTTTLPTNVAMYEVILNTITSGTTANHIQSAGTMGYSQNGNF